MYTYMHIYIYIHINIVSGQPRKLIWIPKISQIQLVRTSILQVLGLDFPINLPSR